MNTTIDLDDLFNDIYYMDLPGAPPAPPPEQRMSDAAAPNDHTTGMSGMKRTADEAAGGGPDLDEVDEDGSVLTEAQKIERKRLRKKFYWKVYMNRYTDWRNDWMD